MSILNWDLRNFANELRPDGRLNLLVVMLCHCNVRMRCYPSMDTLARETGWGLESLTEAKKWLIDHKAFVLVPFEQRTDEERTLSARQHVYQMTGFIQFDNGTTGEYLYLTPEARAEIKIVLKNVSTTEISVSEISPSESEDGYSIKGGSPLKSNISSPKNGDEPNDKAKPVTIDLEETYSGNRALKHYPQLVFDCPFCGERKKIKAHHEITPCCSSPIIWKNNLLISKRLRTRAADAKAAQRAADRQAQLAANPALAYVIEQTGDKITVQPEEAVKINFFVGQNGLPAFKDCVDFAIKQASEKGIYDRGIIKFLINLLPGWGNGKTHVAKAEAGNAKTGRIYKLDEDGEIVFKSGEGEWDPIIWRDSEYAIGETIVVEGVTYIKTAEKVYDRQESI